LPRRSLALCSLRNGTMTKLKVDSNFCDLLSAFRSCRVRYLIIGGWAVSIHAQPRATQHMDTFVSSRPDNRAAAYEALVQFGAKSTSGIGNILSYRVSPLSSGHFSRNSRGGVGSVLAESNSDSARCRKLSPQRRDFAARLDRGETRQRPRAGSSGCARGQERPSA
jgi:hypothetical protein